jgi:hypothetical protein
MPRLTLFERLYCGAVAALALWVGIWCYFFPDMSDSGIPWRLPPLCATLFGSMYFSGAVFTASCMCARRWSDVRVIMPMIAIWTGGLTIVSLFYLPAFNFARTQVWAWFGAYIVYPLIALGLMWAHRRHNSMHPVDGPAPPSWVRLYLLAQGSVIVVLALGLLLAPRAMSRIWPWGTGQMMLQLYAAPLFSYGIGSFILSRRRTWPEIRLALIAIGVFTGAEFVVSLRYQSLLNGPSLSIAFWFVWLAVTTGMLAVLSLMSFRCESAPERARRRAWPWLHANVE